MPEIRRSRAEFFFFFFFAVFSVSSSVPCHTFFVCGHVCEYASVLPASIYRATPHSRQQASIRPTYSQRSAETAGSAVDRGNVLRARPAPRHGLNVSACICHQRPHPPHTHCECVARTSPTHACTAGRDILVALPDVEAHPLPQGPPGGPAQGLPGSGQRAPGGAGPASGEAAPDR